jgi:mRNA interferase MazF
MTMPTAIFDRFDVVVVPFPFTDKSASKRRLALVLSAAGTFNRAVGDSGMAMITSAANAPWPQDTSIADLDACGLSALSVIRMKLFTLDHRFVLCRSGRLSERDQRSFQKAFTKVFGVKSH